MNAKLGVLSLCLLTTFAAYAEKRKAVVDEISGQGYGTAGCGLGSIAFGEKPGIVQVFAVSTNNISGNQTFAISSGTLNCERNSSRSAKATDFIRQNEMALKNDLARGEGETMASLAKVIDCGQPSFPQALKKNYDSTFPQGEASVEQIQVVAYQSCAIN